MTEVQNFMLVVCFGCTIGFLIGTFSIMVSDGIHYLKKRMRMKKALFHKEFGTLKITHLYHKCPKKHEKIQEFIRKRTFQEKMHKRLKSQYL